MPRPSMPDSLPTLRRILGWFGVRPHRRVDSAAAQSQQIVASTPDGVLTLDDQGRILSLNPAAETMFDQSAHKVIGQNVAAPWRS